VCLCGLWGTPGHPVGRIPDPSSVYSTRRCSRDVECVCVAFGAPRGILLGASRTPPAFAVRMQQRCECGLWSTKAAYRLQHGPLQLLQCGCNRGVAFGVSAGSPSGVWLAGWAQMGVLVRPFQAAGHPDGRGPLHVGCMAWMQCVWGVCAGEAFPSSGAP
jgi:hypothetical protein